MSTNNNEHTILDGSNNSTSTKIAWFIVLILLAVLIVLGTRFQKLNGVKSLLSDKKAELKEYEDARKFPMFISYGEMNTGEKEFFIIENSSDKDTFICKTPNGSKTIKPYTSLKELVKGGLKGGFKAEKYDEYKNCRLSKRIYSDGMANFRFELSFDSPIKFVRHIGVDEVDSISKVKVKNRTEKKAVCTHNGTVLKIPAWGSKSTKGLAGECIAYKDLIKILPNYKYKYLDSIQKGNIYLLHNAKKDASAVLNYTSKDVTCRISYDGYVTTREIKKGSMYFSLKDTKIASCDF